MLRWAILFAVLCARSCVLGQPQPCELVSVAGACYQQSLTNGIGSGARFNSPMGLAFDPTGATIIVADSSTNTVRRIVVSTWAVSTIAGGNQGTNAAFADGVGTNAGFSAPVSVAVDPAGNTYISDRGNHRMRILSPGGTVTTFSGSSGAGYVDGASTATKFNTPNFIALDPTSTVLYVADS